MPFINLKLVGKLTREQKQIIAREFSDTLLKVVGKAKDKTQLVIEEYSAENWAKGDNLLG